MKKSLVGIFVAVVMISGCGAAASSGTIQDSIEKKDTLSFSSVQLIEGEDSTSIGLTEATSFLTTNEGYMLPVVTRVYTFPFLTKINDVRVSFSELQERTIGKPVQRSPDPIADATTDATSSVFPSLSLKVYPEEPFSYHIAAGRDGENLVTYVAVHLYPVHYLPSQNLLLCAKDAKVTVSYEPPERPVPTPTEDYDLVIITPSAFSRALQPLVTHKTDNGVTTKLVILDEIYDSVYFPVEGRDDAEKMKYFIKNAFDSWGTTYALLVGGRNGGIMQEKWWIPARYSNLNDGEEGSYLTDLYFSDIYDNVGNFSSWDDNDNGIFAEWSGSNPDIHDMYPEVYVGRLPCTSTYQVKTMVNKIITYETSTYGEEWFKKFVGIAGDTYPEPADPYFEGELATNASYAQIQSLGFEDSMMWTSNGRFTGPESVIAEMSTGCGFVHFSGHGNPVQWSTHPPNEEDTWIDGLKVKHMSSLANGEKLPVVIVGGCHNAQYNTSLMNIIKGIIQEGLDYFEYKEFLGSFWYNEWTPTCWGWAMTLQRKGGAIALIANTGLGYGQQGINTLIQLGRHLEWLFFKAYHDLYPPDGMVALGELHGTNLVYYMNEHPPTGNMIDCKIVQEWGLLGDPSLCIGGYPS
jgi:hypothetical protein